MSRTFLRRPPARRPLWQALSGVGISLFFVAALSLLLWEARRGAIEGPRLGHPGEHPRRAKLILIDRHDTRLEIFGTPAAVSRLLAEVLARVPWVLERFDPEAENAWGQDRTGTLAELDRRREQSRRADIWQGPAGDPKP
jgi:hypothetical protein